MLEPRDPAFEDRVRASFGRQTFMATIGAQLERVNVGVVVIRLPYQAQLTQQHGFLHAGVLASVLDSACGYAALSLAPPKTAVLSVEFKINLLLPAVCKEFFARGSVIRSGRTLSVCRAELTADALEASREIAIMQATIMSMPEREMLRD